MRYNEKIIKENQYSKRAERRETLIARIGTNELAVMRIIRGLLIFSSIWNQAGLPE
jgi:hypothetical protein